MSSWSPDLKMGLIMAILRLSGNLFMLYPKFINLQIKGEIEFLHALINFEGMPSIPVATLGLISFISFLMYLGAIALNLNFGPLYLGKVLGLVLCEVFESDFCIFIPTVAKNLLYLFAFS